MAMAVGHRSFQLLEQLPPQYWLSMQVMVLNRPTAPVLLLAWTREQKKPLRKLAKKSITFANTVGRIGCLSIGWQRSRLLEAAVTIPALKYIGCNYMHAM